MLREYGEQECRGHRALDQCGPGVVERHRRFVTAPYCSSTGLPVAALNNPLSAPAMTFTLPVRLFPARRRSPTIAHHRRHTEHLGIFVVIDRGDLSDCVLASPPPVNPTHH